LRKRVDENPAREVDSALVDKEVLARARFNEQQAEAKMELIRDGGASRDVADALDYWLDFECVANDRTFVREIVKDVAERFDPTDGCTHLDTLIRRTLREAGSVPRDTLWPRIATLVLLEHSAHAVSTTWLALGMLTPLLLAIVGDPSPSPASETHEHDGYCDLEGRTCLWPRIDRHSRVRDEGVNSWRELARDAIVWRHALNASQGSGAKASERLEQLTTALDELASIVMTSLGEVRLIFARVDSADRGALWLMLRDLCDDWLKRQGVAAEVLPRAGSILGARAHALRALRRTFHGIGRCGDCGGRVIGRAERCRICNRAYNTMRQRERRARMRASKSQ
jgi:hypothetical protein